MRISRAFAVAFAVGAASLVFCAATGDVPLLTRFIVPFGALFLAYRSIEKITGDTGGTSSEGAIAR